MPQRGVLVVSVVLKLKSLSFVVGVSYVDDEYISYIPEPYEIFVLSRYRILRYTNLPNNDTISSDCVVVYSLDGYCLSDE